MADPTILQAIFSALLSQAIISSSIKSTSSLIPTSGGVVDNGLPHRPGIHTVYGTFKGIRRDVSAKKTLVDQYLGIPYARPPVGQLRFEKPQPLLGSTGIKDASKYRNECHQMSSPDYSPPKIGDAALPQDEDCLYLNIYKPVTASSEMMPVMVWIHGGGYVLGAGSQYDGSNLADRGVIVVTINYRLDVFGFLSTEGDTMPGNYGMLDQVMALRWVKENIRQFGGNPNLVTVFGESAGSSSVSLLLLSPLCSGLFQRAIMESGSSLSPWAINRPITRVTPKMIASLVSRNVGCLEADNVKMLECLRGVDADALMNASVSVSTMFGYEVLVTPVVEKTFGFLPDLPMKLWSQNTFNHVDTIRGFNQAENGELFGTDFTNVTNATFVDNVQNNMLQPYAILNSGELVKQMLETYVGNETREKEILLDLIEASSDFEFVGPTLIEANIESKLAPERKHFVYQFVHKSDLSLNPSWLPATHTEEIPFVLGVGLEEFHTFGKMPSVIDGRVSDQVQTLWTNFAKYGDPTRTIPSGAVKWDAYVDDQPKVLQITNSSRMLNFENNVAARFTSQILKSLDSNFPDDFIVG